MEFVNIFSFQNVYFTEIRGLNATPHLPSRGRNRKGTQVKLFKVKIILRLTVIRPVYVVVGHPSGTHNGIYITVRCLSFSSRGAPSLTGG
jgi:hypothetical protein